MSNRYSVKKVNIIKSNNDDNKNLRLSKVEKVVYFAFIFFSSLFCAVMATSFFVNFRPFGFAPDLCISLVVACSIKFGSKTGGIIGLLCGFFMDALASDSFSFLIVFYVLLGVIVNFVVNAEKLVGFPSVLKFLFAVFASILVKGILIFIFMCLMSGNVSITMVFSKIIFPEMLCTFVFSLFPYSIVCLLERILRKKKTTSNQNIVN